MNKAEIEQCIPHRDPFLWVDEVTELSDHHIKARKFLDSGLDVFRGHYPHHPVLPGVLVCEACLQAGAILMSKLAEIEEGKLPVVTRISEVKFRRMVRPAETLDIEVQLTERLAAAYFLEAKVTVAGEVAARLKFACTLVDLQPGG